MVKVIWRKLLILVYVCWVSLVYDLNKIGLFLVCDILCMYKLGIYKYL